ncbi:N-acetylmuramoyl-L-alanine amidase [Promicromonospora aerolata]|uniref:N-acetylmuramoyl-L-alanine amidase n=1 Tax=Promicromonospora aerolata TaxID=195749 RepID=A0ABW4VAH6_9MICO
MARHAAAPRSRSKNGARGGGGATPARGMVGRALVLGVAPALMLGGALAPAATATTLEPSLEPEGLSGPVAPEDSALPDTRTTPAKVETIAVAAAPAAATERVKDVTKGAPAANPQGRTVADGEVVLDTADNAGRIAGEVAAPAGFQTVGVKWPATIDAEVPELQVRAQAEDGSWGEWTHLEKSSDVPDGEQAEFMSAPVHVGEAVAVQVATVDKAASVPDGVELTLVTSEQVNTVAATTSGAVEASAATNGPTIITRAEWGAAPPRAIPECPPDGGEGTPGTTWGAADRLDGAVVHHTVNPNDYATVAEAMQLIRNDQAYHQNGHGWCDIGYNFLVDKWGNVYEGAQGSIEDPIIGAHAGGFNTRTVGISMVGTYTNVAPSSAQQDGVAQIAGYRLSEYGVDPAESATFTSAGLTSGGRYGAGEQVVLPRVFGHRDTHRTECPGDLGYPQLASIRNAAAGYAEQYTEVAEKYTNFVQAVYMDSLGREATVADIDSWAYRVSVDGQSVLAEGMARSDNYRAARIVSAFEAILGYTPSSSQVSYHVARVKDGTRTIDEFEPYLLANPQFYNRVGGTDTAYVKALYQHILHRAPTASQLDHWVPRVSTLGRAGVADALWGSGAGVRVRVLATYDHYLDEVPSDSTTAYWVDQLRNNAAKDEATLRRAILVTSRYLAYADSRY